VVEAPSFLTASARSAFQTYTASAASTRPRGGPAGWDTVTQYGGTPEMLYSVPDRDTEDGNRAGSGTPQSGRDTLVGGYGTPRPDVATAPGEDKPARFQFLTDIEVESMPPPSWLVQHYLESGQLSVVFGNYGSFKSFIVLDWAMCIATGQAWLGKYAVDQGPVVYVAGEGIGGMGRRTRAWKKAHGFEGSANIFLIGDAPQLLHPGDVVDLMARLRTLPEAPRLLVLDTLARSMVGGEENSSKDMGIAVAAADLLRKEFGCHVLIVHHSPTGVKKTRGSNALPGAVNNMVLIERDEDNRERVIVRVDKQKEAREVDPLHLRAEVIPLSDDPEDTSLAMMAEQDRTRLHGMIAVVQERLALPGRSSPDATVAPTIVQGIVASNEPSLDDGEDNEEDTNNEFDPMPIMPMQRYSARRLTERIEATR
jgi:AAA domain